MTLRRPQSKERGNERHWRSRGKTIPTLSTAQGLGEVPTISFRQLRNVQNGIVTPAFSSAAHTAQNKHWEVNGGVYSLFCG
jgi:hypothetical protein